MCKLLMGVDIIKVCLLVEYICGGIIKDVVVDFFVFFMKWLMIFFSFFLFIGFSK